ncbi:MAG: ABC transporter permease [Actinomycetes bacterium]
MTAERPADLDFSPGGRAASPTRMVVAQAALELRMMLRNGEQLLLTAVIPLGLLLGLSLSSFVRLGVADTTAARVTEAIPGVLTLAVLSTAFTGLAIQTGFERRYGVLKRLAATPLSRTNLLLGKALAVAAVEAAQCLVLGLVAVLLGWRPSLAAWWAALLLLVLGTLTFAALGLLMAGLLRAEATLAAANLVYLLFMLGGGIVVPLDRLAEPARGWLELLPTAALSSGLAAALNHGELSMRAVVTLAAWGAVAAGLTARTFHWE